MEIINFLEKELTDLFTANLFKIGNNSVSIGSLLEFIFSLFVAIFISNFISNLLKKRLLIKLGIDEGNREAIAVIVRYATAALGLIIVLQGIGFDLGSLAVVAGGLGVGIGFGVQDLTTNFVSGLTLLFDRPVKVGDYIEIESLSGTVKEISIRSTIIKTFDDSAVIVPNSAMIGNKIINWSYESSSCCLRIPVSVADNSDPLKVTEALLNAARMESAVLYNPNPRVVFVEFGEDCFKFELLVWINQANLRDYIRSSLNYAIEYSLRQNKIELPNNDRDLWLRNPEVLMPIFNKESENGQEKKTEETESQEISGSKLSISQLLRQVVYFENLNDIEIRQLIEVGYRQRLQQSEILFRENDPGDAFYIVLDGAVEVYVEKINKHLVNLTSGKFFGELALMLGIPRTATVRALEETILFAINKNGFQKLLSDRPELYEQIVQELAKHQEELTARQQQLREMGLVDATEDDQNPVNWVRKRLQNLFSLTQVS